MPAALWLAFITLVGLWFCQYAREERNEALRHAQTRLRAQVELTALEISGKIESGDLALRTVIALIGSNPDWRDLPRDPLLWQILHDISASMTSTPRLVLIDRDGMIRLHSHTADPGQVSLTDRDYFRHHRDDPSITPMLGDPVFGRVANAPVIPFTRRLSLPDGRFNGVVLTNIDPTAFLTFFRSLDHGDRISFTLLRGDGTVMVRYPATKETTNDRVDIASQYPSLTTERAVGGSISVSSIEDPHRLYSLRRIDRFDLIVTAVLPVKIALEPWRKQTRRMALVIAVGVALISIAGLLLLRRIRAEAEARARLAASEASLNRAQAVARMGSWQASLPDFTLTCSEETRRLFSLPPDGPIDTEMVLASLHPDDRARVMAEVRRTSTSRPLDIEHRLVIGGAVIWVRLKAEISWLSADGSGEIVGTIQDITERRHAEESLRRQTEELARSNTELEQFAYVASHDLREPLRMISSFVDLLARRYGDRLDKDGLEFIAFARDGASRMDRLVLDLLDYSRIGRICKPMQPTDLGQVLDRAVHALALKIEETGAEIVSPAAPLPTVIGAPDELARLFQNLIDNALKYREPSRPIRVTVAATHHGADWTISIGDNGIGIDPQYFDRIFGIFQRLHTRESFEGTGIGLAICKKIVERHDGRIWIESSPGEGSTFFFTLPAAETV
jgi:signal transduction histidine kinase